MGARGSSPDDGENPEIRSANLVSSSASDAIVQAATVHGGIHVNSARPDPVVPRQLLPPPRQFIDRQTELFRLTELLDATTDTAPTIIVIRGPGGVGKTALALRWLADVTSRFPDGQLYADLSLSSGEAVSPEDVLGQFLRGLGVLPTEVPIGLAERTALYRSITASRVQAVLLDNAVSAAQARVLLPTRPGSLAVVTSRRPLLGLLAEGAQVVSVDPLDLASALDLLTRVIGEQRVRAEQDEAARLAELCAGLPVALCVVAARAASRPRRSLARMVDELRDEHARLDALSAEGDLSVRSTFDVAYAELSTDLRLAYRTLGLQPGVVFPAEAVSAALGMDLRAVQRLLDELVDASLLAEWGDRHYRLHDLVRVHALAQALADDGDDERAARIGRTLRWYLRCAQVAGRTVLPARRVLPVDLGPAAAGFVVPDHLDQHEAALDWLERERANLVAAAQDAAKSDQPELAYLLADALQPLFILHKHYRDAIEVGEMALRVAESVGNTAIENSVRKRLARWYARLGYFDRAQRQVDEMLQRTRARADRRGEADALLNLAMLLAAQDRLDESVLAFEQALAVLRPSGRRRGEALALIEFADVLLRQGEPAAAIERLDVAMNRFGSLHPPDPYNEARAAARLGAAYGAVGEDERAAELLRRAIVVLSEQGADHERGGAHRTLAELLSRAGDEEGARRHAESAQRLLARPDLVVGEPGEP